MKKIVFAFTLTFFCINLNAQNYGNGVSDLDGNTYTSVIIGDQEWMASNLKTTKYANGESILNIIDSAQWTNNYTFGAWSYFQNNPNFDSLYGKLYNFYSIQDNRNVCPQGWKVPSKADWIDLVNYLGSDSAGSKLKSTGTIMWIAPNDDATNETGFSGYPSGSRFTNGGFPNSIQSPYAAWWTSTIEGSSQSWYADLYHINGQVSYGLGTLKGGIPIRCIKSDQSLNTNFLFNEKLEVYPNPAQNELSIRNIKYSNELNYIIYDSKGTRLLYGYLKIDKIDISTLSPGVYYLELNQSGSKVGWSKIIKI